MEFMVDYCADWKDKKAAVAGKRMPVNAYPSSVGTTAIAATALWDKGDERIH